MAEIHEGDVKCWFCGWEFAFETRIVRARFHCPRCGRRTIIPRPRKPEAIASGHGVEVRATAP